MNERACHLPGLDPRLLDWETLHFDQSGQDIKIDVPVLKGADVKALAEYIRIHKKQSLAGYPVKRIVEIIDKVICFGNLLDKKFKQMINVINLSN